MKVSKHILYYTLSEDSVLAINTLTGALDIVTLELYHSLLHFNESGKAHIDAPTLAALERRGYLVEGSPSERITLRRIVDMYARRERLLRFVICPTYSCNLRCTYCFEGDLPHGNRLFLSEDDLPLVFNAVDELRRVFNRSKSLIELFGGEPLLPRAKPLVGEILNKAHRRGLPISIVTNGTHLGDFTDELDTHREMIKSVQVTLDGPKRIHDLRRRSSNNKGTFDQVVAAIDTLLQLKVKASVRVNVDLQNIDYIPELFTFMVSKKWVGNPLFTTNLAPVEDHAQSKSYEFLIPSDRLAVRVLEMLKSDRQMAAAFDRTMFRTLAHIQSVIKSSRPVPPLPYYCEANNLEFLVFGPDGYVYACTECIGNKEFAIGEFRPRLKMYDEAVNMWNGRNVLRMDECRECDIALLCGGGCAYSALAVNGDIDKPVCNNARETIYAYLDYIREDLARKAIA